MSYSDLLRYDWYCVPGDIIPLIIVYLSPYQILDLCYETIFSTIESVRIKTR